MAFAAMLPAPDGEHFNRAVPTGRSLKEIKEEGMGESVQTTWDPERER